MIRADLITGFLGAGKTTFLLRYARHLMAKGLRIGILEFDHGAVNVDMLLLQQLRGERCELEMLAAACDADCLKRRLRTKLISMGMSGYDRIIIEPSGVFDVDEFFDTLNESPVDRWFEVGSVITVVDAGLEEQLPRQAEFLLAAQAANAGCILLSRTQRVSEAQREAVISHLSRAAQAIRCSRDPAERVFAKNWDELTEQDLDMLMNCGCRMTDYVKLTAGENNTFTAMNFLELRPDRSRTEYCLKELFSGRYGRVLRVKGFFEDNGQWYQLNATKNEVLIDPIPVGQGAMIVTGEGLDEPAIDRLMKG